MATSKEVFQHIKEGNSSDAVDTIKSILDEMCKDSKDGVMKKVAEKYNMKQKAEESDDGKEMPDEDGKEEKTEGEDE